MHISDEHFERMLNESFDELPQEYIQNLDNVAVVWEYDPTPEQRRKMRLRDYQTLFGLYEGIPLPSRGAGYNLVLPDKITIFKNPIVESFHDEAEIKEQVKRTLWHEIAHHYGLDHDRIDELEGKRG